MKRVAAIGLLLASLFFCEAPPVLAAQASQICEREMTAAAARHDVPIGVLYAVGLTETGNKGSLQPYALNIEGRSVFGSSESDAIRRFRNARAGGAKLIDLGCMQINHYYHGEKFRTLSDMLDPHLNVEYAAVFLKELRAREGSWTMAVARYHAGPNNNPAQKRYVCTVIRNMVASGFGEWTQNARRFCR